MCFAKVRVESSHFSCPPGRGNCYHLVEIGLHSLLTMADKVCHMTPWALEIARLGTGHKLRKMNISA